MGYIMHKTTSLSPWQSLESLTPLSATGNNRGFGYLQFTDPVAKHNAILRQEKVKSSDLCILHMHQATHFMFSKS